jgi:hypothetical protein
MVAAAVTMMLVALALAQASLPFATVAQGLQSNIEEPRQVIVRTAAEWQALWKQHDGDSAPPAVDFTQSIVVAVFLGSRPTAGFTVAITDVTTNGNGTVVEYRERQPPRDQFLAQVLTAPFHAVRINRAAGPLEFRRLGS